MNHPMHLQQHNQPVIGPKTVVLYRSSEHGFGFTLRHFIVYPPESPEERNISGILNLTQPMDTVFVKDVRLNGPAHRGGLRPGDRLLSVNSMPVAGQPYTNVVRAIQQASSVLKLIVVPKDCDILQTLFSETAHSPETNQRPIYGESSNFALHSIQSNANHVPIIPPNMATANGGSSSVNSIESPSALRMSSAAKYLNEFAHRHSFNESIYSEPYNNRFATVNSNRLEFNRPFQSRASHALSENFSESICNRRRITPETTALSQSLQSNLSHRESTIDTILSPATSHDSSATTIDVNSTRSSVYSDRTTVTEQSSSTTSILCDSNETTNKLANQTSSNGAASNAPGSQISLQSSNSTIYATAESVASTATQTKSANHAEQSNTIKESVATEQRTETVVLRRPKTNSNIVDRPVRRISYLKATANDISVQTEETELPQTIEQPTDKSMEKDNSSDDLQLFIQYLKRNKLTEKCGEAELEGKLNIKVAYVDNKRVPVRRWHRILVKIIGDKLQISLVNDTEPPEPSITGAIDLRQFHVTKSSYTKRKHVFKLTNTLSEPKSPPPSPIERQKTEFLIQTDDQAGFDTWKSALERKTRASDENTEQSQKDKTNGSTSTLEKEMTLSKARTWKGLVARQFRRIHGQQAHPSNSPNSTANSVDIPNLASIGVPLSQCPTSDKNKYVPLIMARCTEIVEQRGLNIVGIYRIPGNTAAISALTELVNKQGFDEQTLNDPRWEDVNVVSSLLKLFLRRLPEALLPNDMYKHFIEADKEIGEKRLIALKELIDNIPIQFYESLKHLMHHLHWVSTNCKTNLMEPKNLAIIFGPSVVRASNETLETVVKDMKHQCRIVEALVSHYEFFFENGEMPSIPEQPEQSAGTVPKSQTNLLLDNVSKIESYTDQMEKTRFVFKFVQAARSRKTKKKQTSSTISSMTSDTLSMDSSSTSTEYRDSSITKTENLTDVDGIQSGLSANGSPDLFCEDSGSMSLATLIPALEDKFYALHNGSFDSSSGQCITLDNDDGTDSTSPLTPSILRTHQLISLQPLTIGDETIPFADDSPDQPTLPTLSDKPIDSSAHSFSYATARNKTWNPTSSNINYSNRLLTSKTYRTQDTVDSKSINSISSDDNDSDESNTSDRGDDKTIRINSEVIREMNRILTTLERKATKLNRSLSLNIKYHHNECCCNNGHLANSNHSSCRSIAMNRYSLTKDEKTDKNITKKRQIQDNTNQKNKRYSNRPIKRRHTVGGIHYYGYNSKTNLTKTHQVEPTQTR